MDRLLAALMKTLALLILCAMTACSEKPAESSREIDGTTAERVAAISKLLNRTVPLPSSILDAHFVEEQIGDGRLGPSDFKAFCALTVSPADLPAWRAVLSKSTTWNHFSNDKEIKRAAPKKAQPWWINGVDLDALELYSPHSLTGRANGWVGIAPDGRIFVYTFTMLGSPRMPTIFCTGRAKTSPMKMTLAKQPT